MSIPEELHAIAHRALRELDAAHNFFAHSKNVWGSFRYLVNTGHKVSFVNDATGTAIDQIGLLEIAPHYTGNYLLPFTFRQFVSIFETFFFDFLHRILQHNPWQYARSQIDFETVLRARDRDEVIAGVLQKQLNELKYERVRDWFEALNRGVKLEAPNADEIEALAEIKATRDILEHNSGIVNEVYVRKAGSKARFKPGDRVEIRDDYHLASWQLIKKLVVDLEAEAVSRLAKG